MANPLGMEEVSIKLGDDKGIEKQYSVIQDTLKAAQKGMLKNQCACTHQKKRRPTVKARKDGNGKVIEWVCYRCGKTIDLRNIPMEKLKGACQTVASSADVIKMMCNPELDKDQAVLKQIAKLQWRLLDIPKQYEAVTSPNKKRRNRDNRQNNQGSNWGRH